MRQIELATLMGLILTNRDETDRGYIQQTYRFGECEFRSSFYKTEEECEDEVARDFFKELSEMMQRHWTS